jgi:hypothetical protein
MTEDQLERSDQATIRHACMVEDTQARKKLPSSTWDTACITKNKSEQIVQTLRDTACIKTSQKEEAMFTVGCMSEDNQARRGCGDLPRTEPVCTRHTMLLLVGTYPAVLARVPGWGEWEALPAPHRTHHKVTPPPVPSTDHKHDDDDDDTGGGQHGLSPPATTRDHHHHGDTLATRYDNKDGQREG